jgi:predicted MFS family arabinose efflux permease
MNKKAFTVLLSNYGAITSFGLLVPIFALFVVELGGTAKDAGIASAIYYFLGGIFMLLLRPLINRSKNRTKYYIFGNGLQAVCAFLLLFVDTLPQLFVLQAIFAFAAALRVPAQRALFGQYEDKGKEGSEWATFEGGNYIIMGLSAAFGGIIAVTLSFDSVFLAMTFIQTLSTIYCMRLLKRGRRR